MIHVESLADLETCLYWLTEVANRLLPAVVTLLQAVFSGISLGPP